MRSTSAWLFAFIAKKTSSTERNERSAAIACSMVSRS
jgi:hypothetical protein